VNSVAESSYYFGEYRFIPRQQLLLRNDNPVRVGARALDLLEVLVERQGELVSKSDLIRCAWPTTFVHESNLKVNIAALRRALAQPRVDFPYIVTVPGRGYRFAAPVRIIPGQIPASPSQSAIDRTPQAPRLLVGREHDVIELTRRLHDRNFVTVVGPAGVGKTTVAVAAARQLADRFVDGTCFVDLAAIDDPQLVCAAIASALGSGSGLVDLFVGIVEALRVSNRLLILDNCEHVLAAAALVAERLRSAVPHIGIIATSREPLRSRAESVYRLPPLRSPASDISVSGQQAMTFSAVELFVARAGEAAGYVLSDLDAPIIADICRRLDGIPLAIELAAPRLRICDPATLLRHLNQSFELLSGGSRTAPLRHQALQATLDWSYRLLSDDEAALLRFLSVFAGAFTLEDVLGSAGDMASSPDDIAACLESLASKSLISQTFTGNRLYYRLLDGTRSYAAERLRLAGEHQRACEEHAAYLLRLFERAETEREARARDDWMAAFGRHANDLRKAIDWAFGEGGAPETGLRLTCVALPLWDELSSVGESRARIRTALDASKKLPQCDPVLRMKLATAHTRGLIFAERLDPDAEAACRESVRLAEMIGNTDQQLRALWGLATLQSFSGHHGAALASLDQFDALAERMNNRSFALALARFRHMMAFYHGDTIGAYEGLKQLAIQHPRLDGRPRISQADLYVVIRVSLAFVAWVRGDTVEAARMAVASFEGAKAIGHLISQSNALALAVIPIALWSGDLATAQHGSTTLTESLNQRDLANWAPVAHFLEAAIGHQRGDLDAIDRMRIAVDEILAANFLIRAPIYLCMLAEAALERGRIELARSSIDQALLQADRLGESWCEAELLRVQGLIEQACGDNDRGEQLLLRAMQTARETGALSFQLRSAVALAGCRRAEGRIKDAVAVLEQACGLFASDVRDRDIVSARRLLEQLRGELA
jgi:predicted ATPase/DNA-binding winged helix-turn-helix (wHTH) protein